MICPIWCVVSSISWFVDLTRLKEAGFIVIIASTGFLFRRLFDLRFTEKAAFERSTIEFICRSKSSFSFVGVVALLLL